MEDKDKIEIDISFGKSTYSEALNISEKNWEELNEVVLNEFKIFKKKSKTLNSMSLTKICCEKYATNFTEVAVISGIVSRIYAISCISIIELLLLRNKEYKELLYNNSLF